MAKDLTTSSLDRQNILNNDLALAEIQKKADFKGIVWNGEIRFTREMASEFFEVEIRTIGRYIEQYNSELAQNGYQLLRGKHLKDFLRAMQTNFGKDINVLTKITVLGVFNFRAFLNLAMLLSESEKAKALRQMMVDIS